MSVEYSAIAAKLKAMYSKFLTRDDYEQLLERKSVNDICSYLKSTPGYGEVLEQVNERDIHRGQMEILLEQEMVDEYVRLYNFGQFKENRYGILVYAQRDCIFET